MTGAGSLTAADHRRGRERKRHIVQYFISGLLTMLVTTAVISGFLLIQKRNAGVGVTEEPLEVEETILTAASLDHSAWIRDGKLYVAGEPYAQQEAVESWQRLVQVAISEDHLVALDHTGQAYAIGENGSGQCRIDGEQDIVSIAAGMNCTVCIRADGEIDLYGILPLAQRTGLKLERSAARIAIGDHHIAVLRKNGTVAAYGDNDTGACDVSEWKDVISIAVGNDYTVGVTKQGKVLYTGGDSYRQSTCQAWTDIKEITAGSGSVIGLKKDGSAAGTGRNTKGECEVGDWAQVISIAAGYDHVIGICEDGTCLAAGYNGSGQCEVP